MTILFNNINSDDTSDDVIGQGGPKVIFIRADNFGGGAIQIKTAAPSDPTNRFTALNRGRFTTDADIQIDYLPAGTKIRVVLENSTGASNVFVEVS